MGKDDWYFIVSTVIGLAGLLGVPWKLIFGQVKNAVPNRKRELFCSRPFWEAWLCPV